MLFSDLVPGGGHWSYSLPRGTTLRMTALEDGANLSLVLYSAREKLERYNMPDSLKAQHTAHYTRGHVLMSDMGRAMARLDPADMEKLSVRVGDIVTGKVERVGKMKALRTERLTGSPLRSERMPSFRPRVTSPTPPSLVPAKG